MKRRTLVGAIGTGGLVGLAGCIDFVLGNTMEFEAGEVRVAESVLEETEYSFAESDAFVIEEEFEAFGQTRDVVATNTRAEYEKSVAPPGMEDVEAAGFTAIASPSVSVLGRELNPLASMSTDQLIERIQRIYTEVENVERIDETSVTVGDQSTNAVTYRADATLVGQSIEIRIHLSEAVTLEDDVVLGAGMHPALLDEAGNIRRMMEGIEST